MEISTHFCIRATDDWHWGYFLFSH